MGKPEGARSKWQGRAPASRFRKLHLKRKRSKGGRYGEKTSSASFIIRGSGVSQRVTARQKERRQADLRSDTGTRRVTREHRL